jgi:hypothetical protein
MAELRTTFMGCRQPSLQMLPQPFCSGKDQEESSHSSRRDNCSTSLIAIGFRSRGEEAIVKAKPQVAARKSSETAYVTFATASARHGGSVKATGQYRRIGAAMTTYTLLMEGSPDILPVLRTADKCERIEVGVCCD